jgi:hypothetical protein
MLERTTVSTTENKKEDANEEADSIGEMLGLIRTL